MWDVTSRVPVQVGLASYRGAPLDLQDIADFQQIQRILARNWPDVPHMQRTRLCGIGPFRCMDASQGH